MKEKQQGFGVVAVVIAVVVAGALAYGGWRVWQGRTTRDSKQAQNKPSDDNSSKSGAESEKTKPINSLELDGNQVSFVLPKSWTYIKGNTHCRGNATVDIRCLDGAVITPGEKLPTRYGNGTEFFYIQVSVFENTKNSNAQTWFEEDFHEGIGTGDVQKSTTSINGYDTFSRTLQHDGDGTTIRSLDYAFSVKGRVVHIHARTYEPGKLKDGTPVGDFRKFEPAIIEMAKSVKIKY